MPNPYQRGTDLLDCPKDCEHLKYKEAHVGHAWLWCVAAETDTCPREQAEKPVERICGTCQHGRVAKEFASGECWRYPWIRVGDDWRHPPVDSHDTCGEWKERTNG